MGMGKYFLGLLLTIISFFGLSILVIGTQSAFFIKELYFMFFLLIVAAIALFAVRRGIRLGWMLFALFFAAVIFDALYIGMIAVVDKATLYSVVIVAVIGVLMSLGQLKRHRRRPRIVIEDLPPPKPARKSAKKSTKKTAKKTVRKTAKKKVAKKNQKKSSQEKN